MKTDQVIPQTLPSRENTCLRCGQEMTLSLNEHVELRRCGCGYETRTITGESRLNYAAAVGSFTITRSR